MARRTSTDTIAWTANLAERKPLDQGLRLTADEYLALEDDGFRYELIDDVVCMTPAPTPEHQDVMFLIASEVRTFV